MRLRDPQFLLLALAAAAAIWWFFRRGSGTRCILYPLSLRGLELPGRSQWLRRYLPPTLRTLAFVFLALALSRPQTSTSQVRRSAEGIDIMIAMDVSKSMLIEDTERGNRLEAARDTVKRFIQGRTDDRIGFLMFSGESITLAPPTLDYEMVIRAVDMANTDQLKDGTAIGDAIANSVNRLKDSRAKSRVIILITDGDSNMGSVAPLTAGGIAEGYGVKVYAVALGRDGTVNLPVEQDTVFGRRKVMQRVTSTINPELLMRIAQETGGKYFRAEDEAALKKVFREIDRMERTKVEKKERVRWREHFQAFLIPALVLFLADFILARTILRLLPN
ncbi:MAG: VWA domain-containing protein [Bdellovibrionales bacterium]|nr:VWA domain-containing protein [Bdellovibrionales bacterium]